MSDPIDSFQLPSELRTLLSPSDQEAVMDVILAIDVRLSKEDAELERLRIMGGHLWPVFDAIAKPLQSSPGFREYLVPDFIPRMIEQIRKDMSWYPHNGVDLKEVHLRPSMKQWRNAKPRENLSPKLHELGVGDQERSNVNPAEVIRERAAKRREAVMRILSKKRWKRGRLATEAAVSKNSVYGYLDGSRTRISDENRQAIADALGIKPNELPD